MRHVADGNVRPRALAGITLIVLLIFVVFRARTFHYCAGSDERPTLRIAENGQPCRADENPMEWREGWRAQRLRSKIRMLGNTVAKAFLPN